MSSWIKQWNETSKQSFITWETQGYYWLHYFFCYSLSLTFLTHHPNSLWIHEIHHVLKNKGMITFLQHSIIAHQWPPPTKKLAGMTKGVLTGMCKAEDCLYVTAHKETKLLFSLNWTLNYSLCFGSAAGCDLWVFCLTREVFCMLSCFSVGGHKT